MAGSEKPAADGRSEIENCSFDKHYRALPTNLPLRLGSVSRFALDKLVA